jgi:RNA polymerase sigma factor (sigma-70 family)
MPTEDERKVSVKEEAVMSKDQPYLPRQEVDERVIVEEMIRDQHPEHWEECRKFIQKHVYANARNLPNYLLDDVVQEIMLKITKNLPRFRFQCTLSTWVNQVIEHHIIDEYLKLRNDGLNLPFSVSPPSESDGESWELNMNEVISAEDAFEIYEKIRMGIAALWEYANTHANSTRNRHIIRMVFFEGKTYEEAAKAAGCHAPVVGHIVREAQLHARKELERSTHNTTKRE